MPDELGLRARGGRGGWAQGPDPLAGGSRGGSALNERRDTREGVQTEVLLEDNSFGSVGANRC